MQNVLGAVALRIQYNSGGPPAVHGAPNSISHDPVSRPGRYSTSGSAQGLKSNHLNGCFPFTFWPAMTVRSLYSPYPQVQWKGTDT